MEGWIVFLLVVIAAVLILGREEFRSFAGFVVVVGVAGFVAFMFLSNPYAATQSKTTLDDKPLIGFAPEPKKAPSPKTKVYKPSLLKAYDQPEMWRKLEEGMLKKEVIAILGEPLRIGSDGKSELWYYNGDSALTSRVDFDKKLLRFRVASWKAPDFRL